MYIFMKAAKLLNKLQYTLGAPHTCVLHANEPVFVLSLVVIPLSSASSSRSSVLHPFVHFVLQLSLFLFLHLQLVLINHLVPCSKILR